MSEVRKIVSSALRAVGGGALDLLFPPKCVHCGSAGAIDPVSCLCPACFHAQEIFGDDERLCPRCARPIEHPDDAIGRTACRWCEHLAFRFQYAAAAGRYEGRIRSLIRAYKYGSKMQLAGHLASLLSLAYGRSPFYEKAQFVAAVPTSPSRLKERGYDPVSQLAQTFAAVEGLAFLSGVIARAKDTRPLAGLSARERRDEVLGAFAETSKKLDGAPVILVDDIMTTGSTLDDASRALRNAGAGKVFTLTVARDII